MNGACIGRIVTHGGEATGAFALGSTLLGPPKDRYTLIEQSTTLLKKSSHHREGYIIHSLHDIDYYSFKTTL